MDSDVWISPLWMNRPLDIFLEGVPQDKVRRRVMRMDGRRGRERDRVRSGGGAQPLTRCHSIMR
jgi:hypothetical protein